MNEHIKKLGDLIDTVREEQPDESGHSFVNRYFAQPENDGVISLVRPGSIPVAEFASEYVQTAKLAAVMSPDMAAAFFYLLRSMEAEAYLNAETQKAFDDIIWKLSFHVKDQE